DLLDRIELAGHAQRHGMRLAGEDAAGRHDVLRLELLGDGLRAHPEVGELARRDLDVDALVLDAEELDLLHVGHPQQLLPDALGGTPQLLEIEAVAGDRVDGAEDVPELVVEEGPDHLLRQQAPDVAHLLAHLVPDLRHLFGRRGILQLEDDQRLAGARVAGRVLEVRDFLEGLLDAVGDDLVDLRRGRPRPDGAHDHGPEREVGILALADVEVRPGPGGGHEQQDEERELRKAQRHGRKVEALPASVARGAHLAVPASRTFWPACSRFAPATTTRSPGRRPDATRIPSSRISPTSTAARDTVPSGPTSQTPGSPSRATSAVSGTTMPRCASRTASTVALMPSAMPVVSPTSASRMG